MSNNNNLLLNEKKFMMVTFCFFMTIFFQLTALNHIWSIVVLGRIVNAASLLLLTLYALKSILFQSINRDIWFYYILPGVFIYIGVLINIGMQTIYNVEMVSYLGFLIPWAIYLAIPRFMQAQKVNYQQLWRYFYFFMLVSIILGLLEYLIFYKYQLANLHILQTPNGTFLAGFFSIYYRLVDGTPHYRFYADFFEPGTLAMWLVPVTYYAFLTKRYIGVAVFLVGFYLTDSLGGGISFLLLIGMHLIICNHINCDYSKIL